MGERTGIAWTDATWNPVRGCTKVSPGCKHCYAKTFAERWRGIPGHPYEQGFDPRLVSGKLGEPLHWRTPRRVFVNSMSDLFGEFVPDGFVAAVFGVMAMCQRHTFQVLTKRAEGMAEWFAAMAHTETIGGRGPAEVCVGKAIDNGVTPAGCDTEYGWPLPNAWLGVSVEDRRYGLPRIEELRHVPAALRFLSIEPLLEDLGALDLTGIDWVIVGCESGAGRRPCNVEWVRSIVRQCAEARVPVFVKQLAVDGRVSHAPAEWPEDLRRQEWPEVIGG